MPRARALFGGEMGVEGFSEVLSREVAPPGTAIRALAVLFCEALASQSLCRRPLQCYALETLDENMNTTRISVNSPFPFRGATRGKCRAGQGKAA